MEQNPQELSGKELKAPEIKIKRILIDTDPQVSVFNIEITNPEGGVWHETFGSENELKCFLQGLRAAYGLNSVHITIPEEERLAFLKGEAK